MLQHADAFVHRMSPIKTWVAEAGVEKVKGPLTPNALQTHLQ